MATNQGFPTDAPLTDPNTNTITLPWLQFFLTLYKRTGSSTGIDNSTSFNYPTTAGDPQQVLTSQGTGRPTIWSTLFTKLSQLTNDTGFITANEISGFQTGAQVDNAVAAAILTQESLDTPQPDSTNGLPGSSSLISRSDHSHPREVSPNFTGNVTAQIVTAPKISTGTATWTAGSGPPVTLQPNGSIYSNTNGGTGTRLYVCSGTVWTPISAV